MCRSTSGVDLEVLHVFGSIIKNLSSEDEEKHRKAMEASEKFIKVKQNVVTTRNKYDKTSFEQQQANEQEQFLKGIELDVKERAERRKKSETDAEVLKSKGNKAFKSGRCQEAIDCYTEAIKLVKYFPALYTNRAQAYIKLKNYDAAIDDCKWAIRIDEKCVKAYVHCGRALQKKACFSEAISLFKKGEEIDPKQKDVIAGRINDFNIYFLSVRELVSSAGNSNGRVTQ
ncbi:Tetratricopeptide repeat 12 [Paramuricea clavata]|uniref:Tetratricopeptide repeat 12 n=1 Tax=Paramuricea clavata TaxID=317549 RepID=A0A7D9DES5_PARCT|nr:Tetratricopeptide repeat 12 [Paramuricea clavata]